MKIVIPITGFGKSGGYRVLSQLANYWIDMGHEVVFISHIKSIPVYFPTKAQIIWIDNEGKSCDFKQNIDLYFHKTGIKQFFLTLNSLRCAINQYCYDFDIVLANHCFTSIPVYLSKFLGKKFYYIQAYESEYYQLLGGSKNTIFAAISYLTYYLPLNTIVNSPIYCKYKNISTKDFVYPGLDLRIFYPKTLKGQLHSPLRIGVIGRSEVFKGTKYAYDAYEILKGELEIELWVAFGDTNNSDSNVKMLKPNSDEELAKFYRDIDILIAAGTVQLGAVHYPVIEAMACGTPVITTGYYPANINNSWIVSVHNSEEIVDSIKSIVNNQKFVSKVNNALENIEEFNWEIVSEKMIRYFHEKTI